MYLPVAGDLPIVFSVANGKSQSEFFVVAETEFSDLVNPGIRITINLRATGLLSF